MAKLLDTTVLVDILRKNPDAVRWVANLDSETLCTTRLNVFELLVGIYASAASEARLLNAEQLISRLNILELTSPTAKKAAQIQGGLHQQGKRIDDIDCLTAAIGIMHGVSCIVTRNRKHFEQIPEITVESY